MSVSGGRRPTIKSFIRGARVHPQGRQAAVQSRSIELSCDELGANFECPAMVAIRGGTLGSDCARQVVPGIEVKIIILFKIVLQF